MSRSKSVRIMNLAVFLFLIRRTWRYSEPIHTKLNSKHQGSCLHDLALGGNVGSIKFVEVGSNFLSFIPNLSGVWVLACETKPMGLNLR